MSDDSEQPCLKAKPRSKVTQWLVAISAIVAVVGLFQAYFILDTDTSYVPSSPSYDEPIISSDASVNSRIDERREILREELRREELEILREAWRIDSLEAESDGVDYMIATAPAAAIALNDALSVTELVDYLSTASAAYNRISELWYKKKETVVFRVDLSSTGMLNLPSILPGAIIPLKLPVTPMMSVELSGSAGLDIEPKGRSAKRVSDVSPTTWKWTVTPIDSGEQFLILTTYVHIADGENSDPHTVKSYEDLIKVNVKLWDRLAIVVSTVQPVWAFAGIVVAGLVGAYGWFRRKGWRTDREKPFSKIQGILKNNTRSRRKRR